MEHVVASITATKATTYHRKSSHTGQTDSVTAASVAVVGAGQATVLVCGDVVCEVTGYAVWVVHLLGEIVVADWTPGLLWNAHF